MGDEHLDTVPDKESNEFIKSSVEDLVPIPRESQGILDHMCDIPPPLVFPTDHVEMFPILLMTIRYLVETSIMWRNYLLSSST